MQLLKAGLVLMLLFAGCDKASGENYRLASGEVVRCVRYQYSCGLRLWDCSNGREYFCQTNVVGLDGE